MLRILFLNTEQVRILIHYILKVKFCHHHTIPNLGLNSTAQFKYRDRWHCFPGGSVVKDTPANAGDTGSIPGSGRSPGVGNGNPLQYSSPGKSHAQRSLEGYSYGVTKVRHDLVSKILILTNSFNCSFFQQIFILCYMDQTLIHNPDL